MELFKKKKKSKVVELVQPEPIDASAAALERMARLVDQVNTVYHDPSWPRSHRLWWDFTVKPPRLVTTKWSAARDEIVYPVADLRARRG